MFLNEITYTNWTTKEVITKKLSRITLVVGDNGSGKSYLINSILQNYGGNDEFNTYELLYEHSLYEHSLNVLSKVKNENGGSLFHNTTENFIYKECNNIENWFKLYNRNDLKLIINKDKPIWSDFCFEDNKGNRYDMSQLSSGYEKVLQIIAWISNKGNYCVNNNNKENSLILIDDFETYLHPTLQLHFLKILSNYMPENHQFIISTHSPFVASQFSDDEKIVL
jgi:predicted ATPase